ncbi:MAG TPA: tRNA (adenosine(37)-N6)-dimethylallyltransferase MiaA [Candidatus Stercoripulliclostridium merdipullorum]|uniref:tRNA dimethylallyltransferase n=1 Tax=Candidatus Stercoripulliclostridium merdipullorum TaxID=2840952 RepID=A0A9D1SXN6_9FIRM|nr:tRNA (adenosine(37)-N6)-dimethylallyltransferase MiaA [Candidatus Stercoripulliclostridium merdipullorum]
MILIGGATASGKTALAAEVARKIGGEIVSADSMQIYRGMNIGTAKERDDDLGVVQHMIDICNPDDPFTVADYKTLARRAVADITARGKVAVVAGGTGFYINALLYTMDYGGDRAAELRWRERLIADAEQYGNLHLHRKLQEVDPVSAQKIHPNNLKRVIRALEVTYSSGTAFSAQNNVRFEPVEPFVMVTLSGDSAELRCRIERRVDKMIEAGLESEVRGLVDRGYAFDLQSMQGIGYKEWKPYFDGTATVDDVREAICKNTREYAKRQRTWFSGQYPTIATPVTLQPDTADRLIDRYRQELRMTR